ncbi:unnamed protein product [Musa textilis]
MDSSSASSSSGLPAGFERRSGVDWKREVLWLEEWRSIAEELERDHHERDHRRCFLGREVSSKLHVRVFPVPARIWAVHRTSLRSISLSFPLTLYFLTLRFARCSPAAIAFLEKGRNKKPTKSNLKPFVRPLTPPMQKTPVNTYRRMG